MWEAGAVILSSILQQLSYIEVSRMEDNGAVRSATQSARQAQGTTHPEGGEAAGGNCGRQGEPSHHEEKLLDRIHQLNAQGVALLQAGTHLQALALFQECETTLEHAASCGKTIDRGLILTVLNNIAAAYQGKGEYGRAASYVEAIIYNLTLYLDTQQLRGLLGQLADRASSKQRGEQHPFSKNEGDVLHTYAGRKYELALYLLQFSGLQSQCLAHEEALSNARKAMQVLRDLSLHSWQYETLTSRGEGKGLSLLEDLSELRLMIDSLEYDSLRRDFERAVKNQQASSTMIGSELSFEASLLLERGNLQELFTVRPKQVESSSVVKKQQALLADHGLQKVVVAVGAYFTMGAELEQLNSGHQQSSIYLVGREQSHEGECYHLMALILGYRHLPPQSKFLQELVGIYRQTYNHSPLSQVTFSSHLDQLTQKYKNYMIEKDISISMDESSSQEGVVVDPQAQAKWNEEKKESKKLNELLKQDPVVPTFRGGQENYFMEVPSIDSIEMATSLSNRNKTDNSAEVPPKRHKGSRVSIDYDNSRLPSHAPTHQPIPQCPREEDLPDSRKFNLKNTNNSSKKSKSKKNPSQKKLMETKKMEKSPPAPQGLMTTITERSSKKLKPKRSPEKDLPTMIGSAGVEHTRWACDPRKIASSEQFKPPKNSQFSSVKNTQPIRMNKVKGAGKMGASGTTGIQEMRSLQTIRIEKGSQERSNKGKSKGGKSSTSFKSKKSVSNTHSSKTPLKKQPPKTTTPAKDKIYTSIKQTVRKR